MWPSDFNVWRILRMKNLSEKIEKIVNNINNDDSAILKAMYNYVSQKYILSCPEKVIFTASNAKEDNIIIDVDNISFSPIWDTRMRRHINNVLERLSSIDLNTLNKKELHKILLCRKEKFVKKEEKVEKKQSLDEIIKTFINMKDFKLEKVVYVCQNLTNENIFFINEFEKFLIALEHTSSRNEYIYDTVCSDLENNFLKFNFCDFKSNKCVSQRHKNVFLNNYPYTSTDGCCFKIIKKCQHNNKDGTCKVKCISCKLFICPYLSMRGIGYYASELLLLRAFYTSKQRGICVNSFYESENMILSKLKSHL